MNDWRIRAETMAAQLVEAGFVRGARWRDAFATVPRHVFVPRFFRNEPGTGWIAVDSADSEYAKLVYESEFLITQLDEDPTVWDQLRSSGVYYGGWPTSSSSSPALMALMLEALDIQAGHQVLEIGTGTGYNAAILCHRLGEGNVTSVDVDADLVLDARRRLADVGYRPRLAAADAMSDIPLGTYDRVEVTVAVPTVPPVWIDRTRPGGRILVNLASGLLSEAMFALTVSGDGTACGQAIDDSVYFMPTRGAHLAAGYELHAQLDPSDFATEPASVDFAVIDDHDSGFLTFLALAFPDFQRFLTGDAVSWNWLIATDLSWVHHLGGGHLEYGGPRRLWPAVELLWNWWNTQRRPNRDRLGLTVTPAGHHFWLDTPVHPIQWPRPVES